MCGVQSVLYEGFCMCYGWDLEGGNVGVIVCFVQFADMNLVASFQECLASLGKERSNKDNRGRAHQRAHGERSNNRLCHVEGGDTREIHPSPRLSGRPA